LGNHPHKDLNFSRDLRFPYDLKSLTTVILSQLVIDRFCYEFSAPANFHLTSSLTSFKEIMFNLLARSNHWFLTVGAKQS
jgi:hypothetical protein